MIWKSDSLCNKNVIWNLVNFLKKSHAMLAFANGKYFKRFQTFSKQKGTFFWMRPVELHEIWKIKWVIFWLTDISTVHMMYKIEIHSFFTQFRYVNYSFSITSIRKNFTGFGSLLKNRFSHRLGVTCFYVNLKLRKILSQISEDNWSALSHGGVADKV